jgi:hypothetical protein
MAETACPEQGVAVAVRINGVPMVEFAAGLVTVTSANAGAAHIRATTKAEEESFMKLVLPFSSADTRRLA